MSGNSNLHASRYNIRDEFYTPYSLIENELAHYKKHFTGKTIYCNCDDPFTSNFFKYFVVNFNSLGIKKLYATCYATSYRKNVQLSLFDYPAAAGSSQPYKIEINTVDCGSIYPKKEITPVNWFPPLKEEFDVNFKRLLEHESNRLSILKEDGDFRSLECIEILKQADIIISNPPFSLFREYIAQLIECEKNFLIIGNQNSITHREILNLIRNEKMWLGHNNGHFWFKVPDNYEEKKTDFKIDEYGQKYRRLGNICWYTNLDTEKRHEYLPLEKNYSPKLYPTYDNYDAIEVGRLKDIPCDYYGTMGVPITFLQYYNPDQFIILGDTRFHDEQDFPDDINVLNGKILYRRLLIKRKK